MSDYTVRNAHDVPTLWEALKKEYSQMVVKQFVGL